MADRMIMRLGDTVRSIEGKLAVLDTPNKVILWNEATGPNYDNVVRQMIFDLMPIHTHGDTVNVKYPIYKCICGAQILNPNNHFCQDCGSRLDWEKQFKGYGKCVNCDEPIAHGCICKYCLRAALVPSAVLALLGYILSKL